MTEIKTLIKSQIYLNLDISESKNKTAKYPSGCSVFDVNFCSGIFYNISKISFKNFYVAFITIKFKSKDKGCHKWKIGLENYQLMQYPHSTLNAEDVFTFVSSDFFTQMTDVCALRFILQQPSCLWKEHKISNLRLYTDERGQSLKLSQDRTDLLFDEILLSSDSVSIQETADEKIVTGCTPHLISDLRDLASLSLFQHGFSPLESRTANYEKDGIYDGTSLVHQS